MTDSLRPLLAFLLLAVSLAVAGWSFSELARPDVAANTLAGECRASELPQGTSDRWIRCYDRKGWRGTYLCGLCEKPGACSCYVGAMVRDTTPPQPPQRVRVER